MGINIADESYYTSQLLFADQMKGGFSNWYPIVDGKSFYSSSLVDWKTVGTDENGYMKNVPYDGAVADIDYTSGSTVYTKGDPLGSLQPFNCPYLHNNDHKLAGNYTLIIEGTGKITFSMGANSNCCRNCESATFEGPGTYYLDMIAPEDRENPSSSCPVCFSVVETSEPDYIKSIKFISPGHTEQDTFDKGFLELHKTYAALRFMPIQKINAHSSSKTGTWDTRTSKSFFTQTGINGVSFEYLIELANTLQIPPWFCIYHLSIEDDTYLPNLAKLIHEQLDPNLHFYVEFSNELWNGAYPYSIQQNWCLDTYGGRGGDWANLCNGIVTSLISEAFINEFQGEEERVKIVLAGQYANSWHLKKAVENFYEQENVINSNGKLKIDYIAGGPYFGHNVANNVNSSAEYPYPTYNANGEFDDSLFETYLDIVEEIEESFFLDDETDSLVKHIEVAKNWNISGITSYEGGQHVVATNSNINDETITDFLNQLNRKPRFKRIYDDFFSRYFELLESHGFEDVSFMNFIDQGRYSKYGSWSVIEESIHINNGTYKDEDYLIATCPKYESHLYLVEQYSTCFGIQRNEKNVCSGHGICTSFDVCQCNGIYGGDQCQQIDSSLLGVSIAITSILITIFVVLFILVMVVILIFVFGSKILQKNKE